MSYQQFVEICGKYNIEITKEMYDKFEKYYLDLIEENSKYNLTAITERDDVFLKHFLDSMLGGKFIEDSKSVIDIGCGAGFPSIPLKLIKPNNPFTLVDAVAKKVNYVNNLVNKIEIDNVNAIHARCEDLAKMPKYREKYDYVVARAVANMSTLLEYTIPFLKVGGKLIMYKSLSTDEELRNAGNALIKLNCNIVDVVTINFEEIDSVRTFVIVEKTAPTPNIYPRSQNKARKNPL